MEAFINGSNTSKGVEVLFFQDAEIEKMTSNSGSFASAGPLSVLYFEDYKRFVLQINGWRYPLINRLRVLCNSEPDNMISRSYFMPAMNGYTLHLKINNISNSASIINFETILQNNTDFVINGQRYVKSPGSPDDKLTRKTNEDTGAKEKVSEKTKSVVQSIKEKAATVKTGIKNLTSKKHRVDQSKIKTNDFKNNAVSKFNKNNLKDFAKMTAEFMNKRRTNTNMTEAKDIDTLVKTSDKNAPTFYVNKETIEEAILFNKDVATKGNYNLVMQRTGEEKLGMLDGIRNQLESMNNRFNARREVLREQDAIIEQKMMSIESDYHYEV